MDIITDLTVNRIIEISEVPPAPAVWLPVKNTENIVLVTPEADVWEAKPTNTTGVTQKRTTWITFTALTFDLIVDPNDAEHARILSAIATRTKLLFNVSQSDSLVNYTQFAGYVQSATDSGTDGGGYIRSVTVEPCGSINEVATEPTDDP